MEASFWHNKWEIGQIGFHENQANAMLVKHIDKLGLINGSRIFLPLCGKTLDIAFLLERDYQVVGIELSEIAIEALFEDLNLNPEISKLGNLQLYKAKNIEIYVGDFFDLTSKILGAINAIYDRAALIALPLETRELYSEHLIKITENSPQLVICLEYDQSIMNGPPHSVNPAELNEHYSYQYNLLCVESNNSEDGLKGKYPVTESAWLLTPLNT